VNTSDGVAGACVSSAIQRVEKCTVRAVQGQTGVARRGGECVDGHQRYSPSARAPTTKKKGCEGKDDECSTD